MRSEPLQINDKTFLINRLIQQAPTGTLVREFFKNADENAALAADGNRHIRIYPVVVDGVNKLAFWNTGIGMDADELKRATDLSSSVNKEMSIDGNFGIGAKVSGLTMSRSGIRYRSCKNGSVHEVTIGFDEEVKTYVRYTVELPDGSYDSVYDVTAVAIRDGKDTSYDWTEVVLFGESDDHDTVEEPLGKGKKVDRSYIPTTIFRRFAEFSEGVDVHIDVAMTKGGGKGETGRARQLRTLSQVLDQLPRHQVVKDPDSGISVRYIHDPKHESSSHTLSSRANPATGSTTFCAVVHKGERYDFKTTKGWSAVAPSFGIPFGSRVLTVEILIPDAMALPNQYRDGLTWPHDRSPLTAADFSIYVRELMPEWVKEIVRSESPEANDDLNDLQRDLQKLLDEFRVPTPVQRMNTRSESVPSDNDDEGTDSADDTSIPFGDLGSHRRSDEPGRGVHTPSGQRAKNQKIRRAPDGARASQSSQALERVPEITILIDPEKIDEKALKGRAGRYYKDAQALFVNGNYPVVYRMVEDLERELIDKADPETVREAALKAARHSMAFRVGKATCYAISKRMSEDWTGDDLDMATSPESLSMAADDYRQSLSEAKRYAMEQIKLAGMETEAA